jgi:hypothetical protein
MAESVGDPRRAFERTAHIWQHAVGWRRWRRRRGRAIAPAWAAIVAVGPARAERVLRPHARHETVHRRHPRKVSAQVSLAVGVADRR